MTTPPLLKLHNTKIPRIKEQKKTFTLSPMYNTCLFSLKPKVKKYILEQFGMSQNKI